MNEPIPLPALAAAVCLALASVVFAWKSVSPGVRIALAFSLSLYVLTYYAGILWLLAAPEHRIHAYFGGVMPPPQFQSTDLLALTTTPILVIPLLVWAIDKLPDWIGWSHAPGRGETSAASIWAGVGVVAAASLAWVAPLVGTLIGNAVVRLPGSSGLTELYAARMEVFAAVDFSSAGILYGTLPACATLLAFSAGRRTGMLLAGVLLGALSLTLNAGLFQIAPAFAFVLMCILAATSIHRDRIRAGVLLAVFAAGLFVFDRYQDLKATESDDAPAAITQVLLRMPISLPYLDQLNRDNAQLVHSSDSLSHDVGEYMFPELNFRERFVAMPQPAFVDAWFRLGLSGLSFVLLFTGMLVVVGGRWLDRGWRIGDRATQAMVAVTFGPMLYYVFQVRWDQILISGYGLMFTVVPVLAVLAFEECRRAFGAPVPTARRSDA